MKKKLKYYLISYSKKNKRFRYFLRKAFLLKNRIKYLSIKSPKIDDKMIIFESYNGRSYSDSPKFIYEYMINDKRFKDYKFIWAFKDKKGRKFKNKNTIVIKTGTKEYYKYYKTAKYWIVNSLVPEHIIKRKNQIYFQTWHGTPLKKLRYDIKNEGGVLNTVKEIRKRNDIDVKKIDYFLSPSKFTTEKFISAFNLKKLNKENIIVEKGYPRNANILDYSKKDIENIKKKLNIPKNKKVILYAPTFRDNNHKTGLGYVYDLNLNFEELKKELQEEYVILFRVHYFIANKFDFKKYKGFIYDVSKYEEINDLYQISDILLTDYSSVFFDYAILNKPILFYMYDKDLYEKDLRGFYINLNSLPGKIITKEKDLIKPFKDLDKYFDIYKDKYEEFNRKYNYNNTKNATKEVVDFIYNIN